MIGTLSDRGRFRVLSDGTVDRGDVEGPESPRTLLRGYRSLMEHRFGYAPTLGEIVATALEARTCFDDARSRAIVDSLTRTMSGSVGGGILGGFLIPWGMADDVLDRARSIDGPWARANFWPVPTKEFVIPVVAESSVAAGSRWGGIQGQYGRGEITSMTPYDGKVAAIKFSNERLTIYTEISRDLFADSAMLTRWLSYVGVAEMRRVVENLMINGPTSGATIAVGMSGVINSPCTVKITRATTGQLKAIDIDKLAAGISPGNWQSPTMAFYANKQTCQLIDQLAVSGQWPEIPYIPAGGSPWWPHPTLKGKPLVQCNYCPAVGTAGDLIAADFGDYVITYLKMSPTDSPLAFTLDSPSDAFHRGKVGMPTDGIEARMSTEKYFDTDIVAFGFKMRCDGHWLWNTTSADAAGNTIGPVAVISA